MNDRRVLRIARHTDRLEAVTAFYRDRVGLPELGGFADHDGYDGVLLAVPGTGTHLELTSGGPHPPPQPRPEPLRVILAALRLCKPPSACSVGVWHPMCYLVASMKTIQVRNVPDDVHRELRTRAAAAGVSLSDFALGELERVAGHPPVAELLARARARSGGARSDAIVAAVRSGRDRD